MQAKFVLGLNYAPLYENVYGSGDTAPSLLASTLDGGRWSTSRSSRFIPGERGPGIHWLRGCIGLRAGLEFTEKRKNLLPLPEIESRLFGCPAYSPVAIHTQLSRLYIGNAPRRHVAGGSS